MANSQRTDVPVPVENPAAAVLARFGGLSGWAFEAAIRYEAAPPGTPISIETIRELLGVGTHIARRVLQELTDAGIAVAKRLRDSATGRLLGRLTEWSGPRAVRGAPEAGSPSAPTADPEPDPAVRALELLRSLADVDERLAFKDRELRTLVPFVLARFSDGATDDEVFRELTDDLPSPSRELKTGLLHFRLTRTPPPPAAPKIPAQSRRPRLVECADCGRPGPDLVPGDLCRHCRTGTAPVPLDGFARAKRLMQLADLPL
ncbi:hypothetical protein [Embleya scabrispora]|uniref:hypothetical protein n=1 Tax=Embleya scabrispora TaxID=159449 RepID=UPI00117EC735|nr:hypothetical protein [Embleya scabrispora]